MASETDKGKEKAGRPEETPRRPGGDDHDSPSNTSIVSRIAKSATVLATSITSSPTNPHDVGQLMSTDKAGPSTRQSQASTSGEISGYRPSATQRDSGASFRVGSVQQHVAREEAAFSTFLDGVGPAEPSSYAEAIMTGDGHADRGTHLAEGITPTPQASQLLPRHSCTATDGLEVVNLLDSGYDEVLQTEPDILLTEHQSDTLRRALFSDDVTAMQGSHNIDWENLLNFLPGFWHGSTGWADNEMLRHVGTSDPAEARRIWADQWQDVLSSYTDEVWGDLSSLVKEAREEVQQLADPSRDTGPSESKAVRRLGLILAHIRSN